MDNLLPQTVNEALTANVSRWTTLPGGQHITTNGNMSLGLQLVLTGGQPVTINGNMRIRLLLNIRIRL